MAKKGSIADKVYEQLKKDIMENKPARNIMLTEQNLADMYGTSRTPVHEALARLCLEGYVEKYPKKGYLIQSMDIDLKIRERTQLRYYIELGIARDIIKNANDAQIKALYPTAYFDELKKEKIVERNMNFHVSLSELVDNREVTEMIKSLVSESNEHIVFMGEAVKDLNIMDSCHMNIVRALLERDMEKAAKALYEDFMETVQD